MGWEACEGHGVVGQLRGAGGAVGKAGSRVAWDPQGFLGELGCFL